MEKVEIELRYLTVSLDRQQDPDPGVPAAQTTRDLAGLGLDWSGRGRTTAASVVVQGAETRLAAGEQRAFPFALAVPPDAPPCLATRRTRVHWLLRAKAALEGEQDPEQELELNVFTAAPPN